MGIMTAAADSMTIPSEIDRVLLTEEQIAQRVAALADQISRDYSDTELLLIAVLRGSLVFLADRMRQLTIPVRVDTVSIASYGASSRSTGVVRFLKDLEENIHDRDVLVIEDIVDTGLTLHYLVESLRSRHPKSLRVCALLDKPSRREVDATVDYCGFTIPDAFVVGYGLDSAQKYRNLPYIAALKPCVYEK